MELDKKSFLKEFSQRVLDDRTSLFLGSGGSVDAGYPTWSGLFAPIADSLDLNIDDCKDFYQLAQFYSNKHDEAELRILITSQIKKFNHKSHLIEELIDVGFTNIWTTNYDRVLERNFEDKGIVTNSIFTDKNLSSIDIHERINIFKMNGDIESPESMIITQDDYEKYDIDNRLMTLFLKRELISSTFLFIGYSFSDHLILDCLGEIKRCLGKSMGSHYAIMKNKSEDPSFKYFIDDLEKRYGIHVLLVDEYPQISEIIAELNQYIRSKRVFISGAFSSSVTTVEEFSHAFSKSLVRELYASDYRIYNGIGRRFGTHLIGYANEYLAKNGVKNIERHLIVRPFVGISPNAPVNKRRLREQVIHQCGAVIYVFGENDKNSINGKSGVMEEFDIAHEQHKVIIPISLPGFISEEIWSIAKSNLTEYPYLEKVIDKLISTEDVEVIAQNIVQILDSARRSL